MAKFKTKREQPVGTSAGENTSWRYPEMNSKQTLGKAEATREPWLFTYLEDSCQAGSTEAPPWEQVSLNSVALKRNRGTLRIPRRQIGHIQALAGVGKPESGHRSCSVCLVWWMWMWGVHRASFILFVCKGSATWDLTLCPDLWGSEGSQKQNSLWGRGDILVLHLHFFGWIWWHILLPILSFRV